MKTGIFKRIFIGWIIGLYCVVVGFSTFWNQSIFDTLETKYNELTTKLSVRYNNEKLISVLEELSSKLDGYITKKWISEQNKDYIRFLYDLNRQKISSLKAQNIKTWESGQISKEYKYIIILKAQTKRTSIIPTPITDLVNSGKQLYNTNADFEFYDANEKAVKRVNFTKYYNISSSVVSLLKDMSGIIVSNKDGGYAFVQDYTIETKHPFSSFYTNTTFTNRFVDLDKKYFLENNIYYSFNFDKYQAFTDEYGYYNSTFTQIGIDENKINFMRDSEGRFWYIDAFTKVKLVSKDLVSGVSDIDKFLWVVIDDKRYLTGDTDSEFKRLKDMVPQIVLWAKTNEEKVKKIYAWILGNISYSREFNIEDKKIFSGINTFSSHEWVCDGYVKLMTYMLLYAGINDVTIIRGDVIDAQDFPYIGHAWLKIGDYYYDPTFDDPIGLDKTLSSDKWQFYMLPHDLLYANRFDYADTPESLKTASTETRKDLIERNLYNLTDKYKDSNYLLLKPYIFRKKYGFTYNQKIGIEDLKKLVWNIIQLDNSTIILNGKKQNIQNLKYLYYTTDDISLILESVNYDISNLYVIQTSNGEYRVGYNVTIE